MSEHQNDSRDFSRYDSMTTGELEEFLRQDAGNLGSEPDVPLLMYVSEVIRKRNTPDPCRKTPEEAFETFKTQYLEAEPYAQTREDRGTAILMPVWFRRLASMATVAVLLLAGIWTVGAYKEDFYMEIAQWTKDTFYFQPEPDGSGPVSDKPPVEVFSSLETALEYHNITMPMVPQYIPEGYEQTDLIVDSRPVWNVFLAVYRREGEKPLKIKITQYHEAAVAHYEQSEFLEMYESGGVVYYLYRDGTSLGAAWAVKNLYGMISGPLTIEELKAMVDSIGMN